MCLTTEVENTEADALRDGSKARRILKGDNTHHNQV